MKSVLLLVLFAGLVSARFHHYFDRRAETTTEEPESTESTTESEYTESTTESEGTTEEGFAAEAASDMRPNCEEFEEKDEEALDAHCGDDKECWDRAETCEFILMCMEYGQMSPEEINAKCGEEEECWRDVEECAMFGKIEDRVWRLERILRRLADRVRAISDLPLIQMMLKGGPPMQVPKGAGGPGAGGLPATPVKKRTSVRDIENYLLGRLEKELKNKN